MKNLLYFEEYISPLSKVIRQRKDFNLFIIRPIKSLKRHCFTHEEEMEKNCYFFDTEGNYNYEILKFKNWLDHKNIKIDYMLNDSEYFLEIANKIAGSLNVEHLNDQECAWVRDKYAMKKRFNEIGLKTVNFDIVSSKDDVKKFFLKNNEEKIVLKPRKGMNSINCYFIENINDINNIELDLSSEKYMVETFCYNHEWSIESLVQEGKVLDSYITYIASSTILAAINNTINCHLTVNYIPEYFKFNPKQFIQTIVDGMNLKNGMMTIEVFIDENGYVIPSELGWRSPGCQATMNHSISYGIDIYNLIIDIALHKKVALNYREKILSVGDLYLPNKEGIITKITPLNELLKMDGVINGEMNAQVGVYQQKRRVGNDSSGWVQVQTENPHETFKKMQEVFENFIIETKGDEECVKKLLL